MALILAMNLHHAWIGGLLEHTLQLLKLADGMLRLYPELNRDLVLMEHMIIEDLGMSDLGIATLMIDMEDHLWEMKQLF